MTEPQQPQPSAVASGASDHGRALPAALFVVAAGTTTFRLVNDGEEIHQISIIHLAKGKTLADYADAMKAKPTQ